MHRAASAIAPHCVGCRTVLHRSPHRTVLWGTGYRTCHSSLVEQRADLLLLKQTQRLNEKDMKKILFRMCLAAAILCTGITVSSCDENSPWLQIIQNLLGTNTTYTYSGTATYQCLSEPNSQGAYTKTLADFSKQNSQVSLTTTSVNETEATVVLPAVSQNGVTMSAVTLSGLFMQSTGNTTTLSVPADGINGEGTITFDNQSYSLSNLYVTSASATSGVITMQLTLYFGTANSNGAYPAAVNVKYSGQAVSQQ